MTRLPVLGTGDLIAQKHLPAHLTIAALDARIAAAIAAAGGGTNPGGGGTGTAVLPSNLPFNL